MNSSETILQEAEIQKTLKTLVDDTQFLKLTEISSKLTLGLRGVYNHFFMLSPAKFTKIQQNRREVPSYYTELEKEQERKVKYLKDMNLPIKEDLLKRGKIISFDKPIFELYFKIYLYTDEINTVPFSLTDIVFNSSFKLDKQINFTYNNLSLTSFLYIEIYSTELPESDCLVGSTIVPLFNAQRNLIQGKHVFKIFKDKSYPSSSKEDLIGVSTDELYKELDKHVGKTQFNQSKLHSSLYSDSLDYEKQSSKLKNLLAKSEDAFLEIQLPSFGMPVIYFDRRNEAYADIFFKFKQTQKWVIDPQIRKKVNIHSKDNPITEKFSTLSRTDFDTFSKDIKPSPEEDSRIAEFINKNDFEKLDDNDLVLFWKYRYYLINRSGCLAKILVAVQWGEEKAEKEIFTNIISKWGKLEIGETLFLLSFMFCLNPIYRGKEEIFEGMAQVRKFAVDRLRECSDEELNSILLQLVQALRYECPKNGGLAGFLITRARDSISLASNLYWFLKVECDESIMVNKEVDSKMISVFRRIFNNLVSDLEPQVAQCIDRQSKLRQYLAEISLDIAKVKGAEEKNKRLKKLLADPNLTPLAELNETLEIPFDPKIAISGLQASKCRVFTSAKYPVKYQFDVCNPSQPFNQSSPDPSRFDLMFKLDDDLRQDQLILQMFRFMDNLLKKVNMDFEFTDYRVLSTSKSDGFVEFVPNSTTLYDIYTKDKQNVRKFLENDSSRLESFINSSAGYAVATYILMIGDRHLENLLITKAGRMFHIDFGYILGKDPKPYPAAIKINKDMVEDMGGKKSASFQLFRKKCVDAFFYLRQNAKQIVNMFYLMIHSGIDLSYNYEEVLSKLNDKFLPNLSDEEAKESLLNTIDDVVNSLYLDMLDYGHIVANVFK